MNKYSRFLVSLFALIIGLWINLPNPSSLATAAPLPQFVTPTPVTLASVDSSLLETLLKRSYLRAVKDAEVADESEISTTLQAISANNPNLKWRDYQGQKQANYSGSFSVAKRSSLTVTIKYGSAE